MAYDNTEVEIKLRVDHADAHRTASMLAARGASSSRQIDIYFDTPARSFSSVSPIETWLSCRERDGRVHINYKKFTYGESGLAIDCREIDITVSSLDDARALILALGYIELVTVDKMRIEALVDDILVAVDEVKNLGHFIELEAVSPHGDFAETKAYLFAAANRLGISSTQADERGYPYHLLNGSV
jgi:adenylate cyclase class 2